MIDGRILGGSTECSPVFGGGGKAFAYSANRGIRQSNDNGASWPTVVLADPASGPLLNATALAVDRRSGDLAWFGDDSGRLFHRSQGGWQIATTGPPGVLGLYVDPGTGTCFCAFGGPNATESDVKRSDDGQTWFSIRGSLASGVL